MKLPVNQNPNFTNKVILSACVTSNCLVLRTFDCLHRWSKSLYVSSTALSNWLNGDHTERFLEDDMDTIIRFYFSSDNEISVEILWLESRCDAQLTGYRQNFYIPVSFLHEAVAMTNTCCSIKCLGNTNGHVAQAHIILDESAHQQISRMQPWQKNTLRKALRHAFTWGRQSTVVLYGEWGMDFYFRETNGICGGLCLTKTSVIGADHKRHAKHAYTINT